MKTKTIYSLQRTMIIYFLLIGFASLLVGTEFLIDTLDPELRNGLLLNFQRLSSGYMNMDDLFAPIELLRNKALLMIAIIMAVTIIVLMMFIKNITEPLQYMIENVREISAGDLRKTIRIHSNNELNELGKMINEMSSNLQEIILFSGNISSAAHDLLENTPFIFKRENYTHGEIILMRQKMDLLRSEAELLDDIVNYFSFYSVKKLEPSIKSDNTDDDL